MASTNWKPKRTIAESESLLCGSGQKHETELRLVSGRMQRVYKHLWPTLRDFWLSSVQQFSNRTYIVFEDRRLTYEQVHNAVLRTASAFMTQLNVVKGDRIGICSRNLPEYFVIFWAAHIIGAVPVCVNAWLKLDPLVHCLVKTKCRVIFSDAERCNILASSLPEIQARAGTLKLYSMNSSAGMAWEGVDSFNFDFSPLDGQIQLDFQNISLNPEDWATIMFTSGTTGLPKGVLSTQRQYLTNTFNVFAASLRAALRRGDNIDNIPQEGPQRGTLLSVPFFHVTGSTSYSMMATALGMKIILMRKWEVEKAVSLIKSENIAVAGGVPAMVADLMDSSLLGHPMESFFFGGASSPDSLILNVKRRFPMSQMSQGYGLTETNSVAVSVSGEDYTARPTCAGLPSPVNELLIVDGNRRCSPNAVGEVWIRGANVFEGYWDDPDATSKAVTADGWFKSGDLGYLDQEGFLYIKDRLKDIIIRGGENISSTTVENVLYSDPRISEAAAVGVPDARLGELVAAVVSLKASAKGTVTEKSLIGHCHTLLPSFAVPVIVIVQDEPFELTSSGKILKAPLKEKARIAWEKRRQAEKPASSRL